MPHETVEFSDDERQSLHDLGFAIYRNKIIMNAQPPITAAQLAEVERKVIDKVPSELVQLWKVSFGGELDYDYELSIGDYIYAASLRELFYPGSDHYRDLNGWIEDELDSCQAVAEQMGMPIPNRAPCLPIGGFEYLQRFYVSLRSDEYGVVIVYA